MACSLRPEGPAQPPLHLSGWLLTSCCNVACRTFSRRWNGGVNPSGAMLAGGDSQPSLAVYPVSVGYAPQPV